MRRWRRTRFPVLLLLASYVAAAVTAFDSQIAAGFERSIDLGGFDNNIEDERRHPHGAPGKPSKLDLDVSLYTETDDKEMFELERQRLRSTDKPASAVDQKSDEAEMTTTTATTEPTRPADEEAGSEGVKCEDRRSVSVKCIEKRIESFLRTVSKVDKLNVSDSVRIVKRSSGQSNETQDAAAIRPKLNASTSLVDEISRFARDHVLEIKLSRGLFSAREARTFFGAFGLKKLLLPVFIGVQIIKSILIALFLPSIIGSLGKIVSKGVTSFAQSSQTPGGPQMEENYEFKDNQELFGDDYMQRQPLGTLPASAMYDESMLQAQQSQQQSSNAAASAGNKEIASRFAFVDPRLTAHSMQTLSDRYYTRHVVNPQAKRQDFKVFHEIPTSSLLLTNYDPFYSPLLSRLDAVFSRLGHNTEGCREYAVCAMYRSPARYAPYSNLVSAQLSRELNELRKPSSDNPDVLRFFRYMKAAKDGQDGMRCEDAYADCDSARDDQTIRQNQAMLATYQDIDKLVHARKLQ